MHQLCDAQGCVTGSLLRAGSTDFDHRADYKLFCLYKSVYPLSLFYS